MEVGLLLLAAFLGASVASFGQCVVMRSFQGKSWVTGRSVCDSCGHQLSWRENLPIFSYVFQAGKSSCCGQRLSISYLLIELSVALLTAGVVWFLIQT